MLSCIFQPSENEVWGISRSHHLVSLLVNEVSILRGQIQLQMNCSRELKFSFINLFMIHYCWFNFAAV